MIAFCCSLCASALLFSGQQVQGQVPAVSTQVRHASGQTVAPVYEGWFEGTDGLIYAQFGYFNPNTQEIVDVPIGANNRIEPGTADQGQPTRFFLGRRYGVFAVSIPRTQTKTEIAWTLTIHGQTLSVPATLDPLYLITPLKETAGNFPGNTPPVVKLEPSGSHAQGPAGLVARRIASVGTPLTLDVWVSDDGLPPPPKAAVSRLEPGAGRGAAAPAPSSPPGGSVMPRGLAVTWTEHQGAGPVTFGNASPALEHGKATTTVTFSEPGEYMLRVLATDGTGFGGLCCWTNAYVRVTVAKSAPNR